MLLVTSLSDWCLMSPSPKLKFPTKETTVYLADCNIQLILQSESLNCFSVIKAVWDVLDDRGSNETGLLELSKTFRTCK